MGVLVNLFKSVECYNSIETLPVHNWFKINETNELKWLINGKKDKLGKRDTSILVSSWDKIMDEFFDSFGIPEKMKKVLELKRDIFVLKCDMMLTGNKTLTTFIKVKEFQLEKLLETDKVQSTGVVKVYIEKYLGRHLDLKTISVKEFYEYLEVINNEVKAKQNGRG